MNIKNQKRKKFIPILKENTKKLKFHNYKKEIGTRYLLVDSSLCKDAKFYLALRSFNKIDNIDHKKQHVLEHKHTVDSYWFFGGDKKNLKGLKVKVKIGDVEDIFESPLSIYIPKNTYHYYIPIKGSGFYFNLVLTGKKRYNQVTKGKLTKNENKRS